MDYLWHIKTFGELSAHNGTKVVERFQTRKTGALFAYLALHPNRQHSRDRLASLFWPDAELQTGRGRLRQALNSLRRQFEPPTTESGSVFIADRSTIRLNPASITTDVLEFESTLSRATNCTSPETKVELYRHALEIGKEDLLPNMDEDWVYDERQRLQTIYVETLSNMLDLYESLDLLNEALQIAEELVKRDPLEELNHFKLIRLYALTGDRAAAYSQYKELKTILSKNFGDSPSAATRSLLDDIKSDKLMSIESRRRLAWSDDSSQAQESESLQAKLSAPRLPATLTRFFGREQEIALIQELIQQGERRCVTLTGAGGCGKTRLALEVASQLQEEFEQAVWFVSLAEVSDSDQICEAIIQSLQAPSSESVSAMEQIVQFLSGWKRSLIILDNFEHLVDGYAVVSELQWKLPGLQCIITSRHRLNLENEQELQVSPLPIPTTPCRPLDLLGYPSTQLFLDRAQLAKVDFQITERNVEMVQELCSKLEGIPLAIELAASWAQTLTLAQMLDQLNNRFEFLVSRRKDIPPRQRTLRATIDYSYFLMSPELRKFFTHLAVFQNGWTLEAAEKICGHEATLQALTELQDRSLIIVSDMSDDDAEMRYRMLDTIRDYALCHITQDEMDELSMQHMEYFTKYAQEVALHLDGPEQLTWFGVLRKEHANLIAALQTCIQHKLTVTGMKLVLTLTRLWEFKGPLKEGRRWLAELIEHADAEVPQGLQADALERFGRILSLDGELEEAIATHHRALELYKAMGNVAGVTNSLNNLGIVTWKCGDHESTQNYTEQSYTLAKESNIKQSMAKAQLILGNLAIEQGHLDKAKQCFDESLEIEQELGNLERESRVLFNLGVLALVEKQRLLAINYFQAARQIIEQTGEDTRLIPVYLCLAMAKIDEEQYEAAHADLITSLQLQKDRREANWARLALAELARVAYHYGEYEKAAFLLFAAKRTAAIRSAILPESNLDRLAETLESVSESLSFQAMQIAKANASRMSLERVILFALQGVLPQDGNTKIC